MIREIPYFLLIKIESDCTMEISLVFSRDNVWHYRKR